MAVLSLVFLGTFEVTTADAVVRAFRTDKVRALLVYLALEAARPHRRERLAALFWPESDHETARYNLRLTLHRLRQTLDAAAPGVADALLDITRQTVEFHASAAQVDVYHFQRLVGDCETHAHEHLHQCVACLARLQEAVELYHGELLAGFSLADAPPFEEWLLLRRETLHHLALLALHHLATAYETQGNPERALFYAQRKLALDPYREETHQQVIRLLARCGLISQALAQYESCRRLLREEVGIEPEAATVALAEQIRSRKFDKGARSKGQRNDVEDETTPELQSKIQKPKTAIESPPHNLPTPLTPFVGREQELAELRVLLQQPAVRLLTLVGPGGMGKTRLALEVGQTLLATFADGVFWVSLASLAEPSAIAPAIASALGLTLQGNLQRALCQTLRLKQILLMLDNCEHLLPATFAVTHPSPDGDELNSVGQLVADLLQSVPGLRILATSRERLHLRAEHLYAVEGMAFARGATLSDAAGAAAVRLFVKSVQRIQPHFTLQQTNLSAVLRICHLVQGMPLGLELAAAWGDQLTVAEIAREIERSVDFLTAAQHDLPARQRSMSAVFAWSWRLLSKQEQEVLRQLSIFRGGFTRDAAEAITGASLRVLTSLVHKSLLRLIQQPANAETEGNAGRYELHELLRQFAEKQLALTPDEAEAVAGQHSKFYLRLVAQREQRLMRNDFKTAVAELQVEIDNIRQAWATAARQRQMEALDTSAFALWKFYEFVGLGAEGVQIFHSAAECIGTEAETSLSAPASQPFARSVRSKLLAIHGSFLVTLSKQDQALVSAQQAVAWKEQAQEEQQGIEGETLGYLVWGQALRRMGQNQEARRYLDHVLELCHRYPPTDRLLDWLPEIESRAYGWLCSIALNPFYDYTAARTYAEQKLQLARNLSKRHAEMAGLSDLADIALAVGNYPSAQQYYEQVLNQARKFENRNMEAISLDHLGRILQLQGHYESGYHLLEAAVVSFRAIGNAIGEFSALNSLIHLSTLMGAYALAHAWCEQFLQISQTVEPPLGEFLDSLLPRALLAHYTGESAQAMMYAEQSWQVAQRVADPLRIAHALVLIGHVQSDHQPHAAATAYTQALSYYAALRDQPRAIAAQAGLAQIALAQGNLAGAQTEVEAILPVLAESPDAGVDEPFRIYLTCYRVLAANHDPCAFTLLQCGYDLLQQYASQIQDHALRCSFLENVVIHRDLVMAYHERQAQNAEL